jgi:hypothetical protein
VTTKKWIEEQVADIPINDLPGSWRLWDILIKETFAFCRNDAEADGMQYLNRNAAAHGFGSRLSNEVDSLNAVLLAHFAIGLAAAFRRYTIESP